jgi:hypothetical protein
MQTNREPGAAKQYELVVDDEKCKVWTARKGHQWSAWGEFRDRRVTGTGRSESEALGQWKLAANSVAKE